MSKRISFFDQYPYIGGGQTVLLELVAQAVTAGFDVAVFAPGGGALEHEVKRYPDVVFKRTPVPDVTHGRKSAMDIFKVVLSNFRIFLANWNWIRGGAIYINGGRLFFLGGLAVLTGSGKVFFHLHIAPGSLECHLLKFLTRFASLRAVLVNSDYIAKIYSSRAGEAKMYLVENELPTRYCGLPFREPSNENGLTAVVSGTIRPEKGQHLIFDLAKQLPWARFILVGRVGEGAESWFASLVKDAPPNLTVHPASDDVIGFIRDCGANVSIVPSQWDEPFGLVAIEGMACSCVTLVSPRGGLESIARRTGAITFDSVAALAETMRRLASIPREEFAGIARAQFDATKAHFGNANFGPKIVQLLSEA
jgi:glycosyltransferase involved in cell wall biosynthesis